MNTILGIFILGSRKYLEFLVLYKNIEMNSCFAIYIPSKLTFTIKTKTKILFPTDLEEIILINSKLSNSIYDDYVKSQHGSP